MTDLATICIYRQAKKWASEYMLNEPSTQEYDNMHSHLVATGQAAKARALYYAVSPGDYLNAKANDLRL